MKRGTRLGWAANQDGTGVRGSQQRSPEGTKVGAGAQRFAKPTMYQEMVLESPASNWEVDGSW